MSNIYHGLEAATLVAAIAWAFSSSPHSAADARPACEHGVNTQPSAAQLEAFLNTTQSMPKTFFDEQQFNGADGTKWRFNPPVNVTFRQPWMAAPRTATLAAMKVSQRPAKALTVLLLKTDGSVVPLEGGRLGLLDCS